MPIPPLNPDGFLPVGIHLAALDEIRERFGVFRGSDRRPHLFARLLTRRFRFDVIVAERDSGVYRAYVDFFSLVRNAPGVRKGILQITL